MKNRLTLLLETRYGDLRASEKKAASYILSHKYESFVEPARDKRA